MISPRLNIHYPVEFLCEILRSNVIALLTLCLVTYGSAYGQVDEQPTDGRGETVAVATTPALQSLNAGPRDPQHYEKSIKPLLQQACFECHSGKDVEGNFRADQLDPDLVAGKDIAWWLEVYSVLSKGEMPPPDSSELTDDQRAGIVQWLASEIQAAEKLRQASGNHSSFRRLTRYEYNYALQDLLGVPWTFAGDLPAEASEEDAFENNAESLHMSVKQVQTYHALALKALQRVTVRGARPPVVHWAIPMRSAFQRETKSLERDIQSARAKFEDMPDKLAAELERLNKQFQTPADRSHYLELSTGRRAEVDWSYRKASYAVEPVDSYQPMPEPDAYYAVVQPGSRQALTVELGDRLPDQGKMRVRIRASRAEGVERRIPSLQLYFGFQATDQGRSIKRVSQQDVQIRAPFGQPEIYQWDVPLSEIEHRNTYRGEFNLGDQPSPSEYIRFTNSTVGQEDADEESPAILIDYVEVSAPVYDQWPPRSHRNVFVTSEDTHDENAAAREIIADFMARAWRRPPSTRDIDRKLRLFEHLRPSSRDFQEAVVEVLATILTSPKFLYVLPGELDAQQNEAQSRLSQTELATRLSLFLWCSLPDETLLQLSSDGRLSDPEVLRQQVDRMLADPRATRFSKHFVKQWLKMQPLEYLSPTRGTDGIDEALLESMKLEPVALFEDMLRHDSSVLEFIDSNYAVVNERLATHYGIPGVQGNQFRRVVLPAELQRGGLLTQAGLLTLNSDGKDSHPVKRGVWLLTNLLNDPPPPPPPAVPEIDLSDPEIAKLTLKERIEDHRDHAACLSCHQKIDPWGIAFENYDALGRWRDQIKDRNVDATSVLPNQVRLDGMMGLKEYLVQDHQGQFVRATVEKMAAFALGRQLAFKDRPAVTDIARRVRESGDGLTTMVTCLVTSELFRSK
ncbi:DUF1592 domain-containing protein [Roseimaritima ulvae]|uniref:Planctomycete cytochrome C n=1 Tax=Roseimaritima ulvae TaxID=980254 RepID=A0A5B9QZA3_9BACT|nr:DUF1592 domain-containing protein [Roseimaritima ulvae]QEG39323.1 hypothetical protein UC8_12880 [Roseimaritima ulvae]